MDQRSAVRLGVNIDHVATLRRLRDTPYPNLLNAALESIAGGADQITVHLREDRRHIIDDDVRHLKQHLQVDLNLEMAATEAMLRFALDVQPSSICLVPEKREERTTEGGLDLNRNLVWLGQVVTTAKAAGIRVGFFIEPEPHDITSAADLGADSVELHTGALCIHHQKQQREQTEHEWKRLKAAVAFGNHLGLHIHAGHGIDYDIAAELGAIRGIVEYNIGHAIICEAVSCGLREATRRMKQQLQQS